MCPSYRAVRLLLQLECWALHWVRLRIVSDGMERGIVQRGVPEGVGDCVQRSWRVCEGELYMPSWGLRSGVRDDRRGSMRQLPSGILGAVLQQGVYRRRKQAMQRLWDLQWRKARGRQLCV